MSLRDLVVNESELNEELLEKIVRPFVSIAKGNGSILLTGNINSLTIQDRILVYLLGRKAAKFLRIWPVSEPATPLEIGKDLTIDGNSLRPNILQLKRTGYLLEENGRYSVPNYRLKEVENRLKDSTDDIPF